MYIYIYTHIFIYDHVVCVMWECLFMMYSMSVIVHIKVHFVIIGSLSH